MSKLRFKNLPSLLNDIRAKGWIIDSFPFTYNGVRSIVVLRLYKDGAKKPDKFAVADVEFVSQKNMAKSIKGYVDFFEVHFHSLYDFIDFFKINDKGLGIARRDLFISFAECFSRFIPKRKTIQKENDLERRVLASRIDPNDPEAVYCFDVVRNGAYPNGRPHQRSIENSEKAELLRNPLYQLYKDDLNYSFCFSKNPDVERSDEEIMMNVAQRNHQKCTSLL